MQKIALALLLLWSLSYAEQSTISPADLTQVKTFLWGQLGNEEYTLSGGLSGNITPTLNYLALLQYSRSYDRGDDKSDNLRVRLFGVDKVNFGFIDSVGVSIDYIDIEKNVAIKDSQLVAYGAIVKIDTGVNWLDIFPNIAYVTSKTRLEDGEDIQSDGYQVNLFASVYLDTKGKYLMLLPQYTNTKYTEIKKMEMEYGQPLSTDMKWWFNTTLTYEENKLEYNGVSEELDPLKSIKVGVIYYF